jgi:hypothetical protein
VEDGFDRTLDGCASYLIIHGWEMTIEEWTPETLRVVAESVRDLKAAAGWDRSAYVDTMTANGKYNLRLDRADSYFWDSSRPADVRMRGNTILMTVYKALYDGDLSMQRFNLVHEQAHVWDFASGGAMSTNLKEATGSTYSWFGLGPYIPNGATSTKYRPDHLEDWAETVAAAVYPDGERSFDVRTGKPAMGEMRQNHI